MDRRPRRCPVTSPPSEQAELTCELATPMREKRCTADAPVGCRWSGRRLGVCVLLALCSPPRDASDATAENWGNRSSRPDPRRTRGSFWPWPQEVVPLAASSLSFACGRPWAAYPLTCRSRGRRSRPHPVPTPQHGDASSLGFGCVRGWRPAAARRRPPPARRGGHLPPRWAGVQQLESRSVGTPRPPCAQHLLDDAH